MEAEVGQLEMRLPLSLHFRRLIITTAAAAALVGTSSALTGVPKSEE